MASALANLATSLKSAGGATAGGLGGEESKTGDGSHFTLVVNGQIESADFPLEESLYCKYSYSYGADWTVISGLEEGLTQVTKTGIERTGGKFVWAFPVEIAFKSTNVYGWPQLALRVYGVDSFGRDVGKGYGAVHLPLSPGHHKLKVHMFAPLSSSTLGSWLNWLTGKPPEYVDPVFPARGEGREVTRVRSSGTVAVSVNVVTKDMAAFGYSEPPPGITQG